MKVLHVYKDYEPIVGGIENHIKTLAEAQVKAGHDVTVLVTNPGGEKPNVLLNGVHVIRASRLATIASTPLSIQFPGTLAALKPDITHLHFPYPVGEVSQWLVGEKRPFVITYHSDIVKQQSILRVYGPLLRRILARAAQILPTSEKYVATSPWLQPVADKCTAVPLSVSVAPFEIAEPLFPKDEMPILLFVGVHRYYKGLDTLIRAMPELSARLLVGGDGPMRAEWHTLAKELGVTDKVQFLGQVSDENLPRLYASADMFVLPANARAEAFGKVLLEAMAARLPCITTEVGTGTSFVVQDGVTGLVVPPKDEDALKTAVNQLISNPSLRQQMGAAGRERVLTEFTPELMVERVENVYRQVLKNNGRLLP
jgi:glycosyltransferase involved in cell wall biosynthesis